MLRHFPDLYSNRSEALWVSINAMIQPDWILVEGYDTTWVNFRISPAGRTDFLARFIVLPAPSWAANRTRTAFLIVSWHCSF